MRVPSDPDPDSEVLELPIVGFEVIDIWFSGQMYVVAYGAMGFGEPGGRTQIALAGPFRLRSSDGTEHRLDAAEAWSTLVPVLAFRHACIVAATADRSGVLDIAFDDGSVLTAGPAPMYENWQVAGPTTLNLLALPSGGLCVISR